ncbi:MAG TPA: hypothetical protein PLP33_27800 [Leptospiraceae bacterium]|nr:hypothetical protein [Leptospiraceae bacterium]
MKFLVGIHGKKRSGKNTAADVFHDNFNFKNYAFADALKEQMYDLDPDFSHGYEIYSLKAVIDSIGWELAKEKYPEVRRLLQRYGTEVMRKHFGEDVWVNLLFKKLALENPENVTISDVRFENEVRCIKELGGFLIKIKSNRTNNSDDHASEKDLPDDLFDFVIENNSNLETYQKNVFDLAYGIVEGKVSSRPYIGSKYLKNEDGSLKTSSDGTPIKHYVDYENLRDALFVNCNLSCLPLSK